jgi:CzcA family heavy metal efflux pump
LPWGNTLEVTRGVEQAIDEMRPGLPGMDIDTTIFRPATFIDVSIDNLTEAMLIGTLLVIFVLIAFLFEWRAALISLLSIPLSLIAALLVLSAFGTTINTMVLAGFVIAVGVVVDDSIIDIENIVRRLRQHRKEGRSGSVFRVILDASIEVRNAMVYATLIIVLAVLPILFLTGVSGAFFRPLVLAYGLAVLASMVVAITVTPALSLILLRNTPLERRDPPLTRLLQKWYTIVLAAIVRRPRPVIAATALTLLAGIGIVPLLGQELLPPFKERDFLMHWVTKPGTSHAENVRIGIQASKELRAIPGVRNFGSHIGRAIEGDEVYGINFSENWISIDPDVDYDKTRGAVEDAVVGYPGLYRDVQTYLGERIKEVVAGSSEAIVVRIFGPDLGGLRTQAAVIEDALREIPGIEDLQTDLQQEIPHIQVTPDLAKAEKYGLKPGDIRRAAATIVSGDEVSDIHKDGKVYDIMVWSKPSSRASLTSIRNLLLDTDGGGHVLLKDVADVSIQPTPNAVTREDNSRSIDVSLNPGSRSLGEVASDVDAALENVQLPLGYHTQVLGEFEERQSAVRRMVAFGAGALIGIFLMLHASFGRMRLATLSFLTLPFALVGGILAASWNGGLISLGSLVGFFTVFGIAARNGILLINHFQHLERVEGVPFGPALVIQGARERLAPILMTALATGLALVPLVISGEIPGAEIEYPMAIVILGGLITSTLLNLFVVPSLYLRYGRRRSEQDGSDFGGVPLPS